MQERAVVAEELVVRARAGDAAAFAELVAEHGPDVLRLCTVITADQGLAEDAAQNTWQRAWRRLDTLREPAALRPWLLKVAANEAKQLLRRDRRHAVQILDGVEPGTSTATPDDDIALRVALRALEPGERELLANRYVLGLTSEEIGQQLGLSAEGVRSRLKRVRDRLRKELDHGPRI
jgi:RNA polymerase sigma-70 factor (ECF subfamily)